MDASEVKDTLCRALTEIQASSGRSAPILSGGFRPLGGLEGFDSYNCVEAAMILSSCLGCEISEDIALFTREGHARTIDEITQDLCLFVSSVEGK